MKWFETRVLFFLECDFNVVYVEFMEFFKYLFLFFKLKIGDVNFIFDLVIKKIKEYENLVFFK